MWINNEIMFAEILMKKFNIEFYFLFGKTMFTRGRCEC